jgi:hypothetical protein
MESQTTKNPIQEPVINPVPVSTPPLSNNRLIITFSILVVILISFTAFLGYQNYQLRKQQTIINKNATPTPIATQPNSNNNSGEVDYYFIPKPFVSFQSPAGWIIGNSGAEELVLRKGLYCGIPSGYEACPDCYLCYKEKEPDYAQIAVYKTSFCKRFGDKFKPEETSGLGKCSDIKIDDFLKNVSILFPENGLIDNSCGPYAIHKKAQEIDIGKYKVVVQESGDSCTYEAGHTTLTYYFYLPDFQPFNLIEVSFNYWKNSDSSKSYLMEFNNFLKTIEISNEGM